MYSYSMNRADKLKWDEFLKEVKKPDEASKLWVRWKAITDLFYLGSEVFCLREAKNKRSGKYILDPVLHKQMALQMQSTEDTLQLYPRGHLKSAWLKFRIIQCILQNPNIRIGLWTKTTSLARKELKAIKSFFAQPILQEIFPDIVPPMKLWEKDTADALTLKRPEAEGYIPQENQIEVWGIESVVTGHHYDAHFYDDVLDDKSITTTVQLDKLVNWWAHVQAIKDPEAFEKMIGTRYHYHDLYGMIMQEGYFKPENIVTRKAIENGKPIYKYFTLDHLGKLRKRMGDYVFSCNIGIAPIWMADGTFKQIKDVAVGDKVIGYSTVLSRENRNTLLKSEVLAINSRMAHVVKVKLENGDEIICTPDHKWYTGYKSKKSIHESHRCYAEAHVGGRLMKMINPVDDSFANKREWAYLGGIIDGEGACKHGSIAISQSPERNPEVYDKIKATVETLGIDYLLTKDTRPEKDGALSFVLKGGRQTKIEIINKAYPAKSGQIMDTIFKNCARPIKEKPKVVSIEYVGQDRVYSMQTTTGNYVAWGYASRNCQYLNEVVAMQDRIFVPPYPEWHKLPEKRIYYITVDPATGKKYSNKTGLCVACVDKERPNAAYFVEAYQINEPTDVVAQEVVNKIVTYHPERVGVELGLQQGLKPLIDMKLQQYENVNKTAIIRPMFIDIPTNIARMSKAQKIARTLGAMVRDGRVYFKGSMKSLYYQMDMLNPNSDANEDDIVDAAAMMMMIIPFFTYAQWWKSEMNYNEGYSLEAMLKRQKKKGEGWGAKFAC